MEKLTSWAAAAGWLVAHLARMRSRSSTITFLMAVLLHTKAEGSEWAAWAEQQRTLLPTQCTAGKLHMITCAPCLPRPWPPPPAPPPASASTCCRPVLQLNNEACAWSGDASQPSRAARPAAPCHAMAAGGCELLAHLDSSLAEGLHQAIAALAHRQHIRGLDAACGVHPCRHGPATKNSLVLLAVPSSCHGK